MIKIKDFIFNENEIVYIVEFDEDNKLRVRTSKEVWFDIPNATFEDIEWNYENNNEYCNVFYEDRIKELEEENERLKELNVCVGCNNNPDYKSRIDKAIEYIEEHKRNVYDTFGEGIVFGEMGGIKEIIKILKGEENESN